MAKPLPSTERTMHPCLGLSARPQAGHCDVHVAAAPITERKDRFIGIQKTYGNQACCRMVDRFRDSRIDSTGHDFAAGALHTQLPISEPSDEAEHEADRVAEAVMRSPGPSAPHLTIGQMALAPPLRRECGPDSSEMKCAAFEEKDKGLLPRAIRPGHANDASPIPREALRSSGQPLDPAHVPSSNHDSVTTSAVCGSIQVSALPNPPDH